MKQTTTTSPSYHIRPSVKLENPIFFDFPIDNVKYSTGPRMSNHEKFHTVKAVPLEQKDLVYDPFNPPRSSKLPNLNSFKSDSNLCTNLNAGQDNKNSDQQNNIGGTKQKEICEPQTRPSQIKIHNMQSFGIGTGSETSLGISKASSSIAIITDDDNGNNDQAIIKSSNSNATDILANNHAFPQTNYRIMVFSGDFECGNLGYVYRTGLCEYEINILPDTSRKYIAHWYFFRVENVPPGTYKFTINGIFRNLNLHNKGVQPVALSMNSVKNYTNNPTANIDPKSSSYDLNLPGWQRYGSDINFYRIKKSRFSLSFSFSVNSIEPDTLYFAYLYPYTYTQLRNYLSKKLPPQIVPSILCKTPGGIDYPAIFWDADLQQCVDVQLILNGSNQSNSQATKYVLNYNNSRIRPFTSSKSTTRSSSLSSSSRSTKQPTATSTTTSTPKQMIRSISNDSNFLLTHLKSTNGPKKPLIIFTARHHPGETCASYAMEGFMDALFCHLFGLDKGEIEQKTLEERKILLESRRLLHNFSFLVLPMMNIDGVVGGYFRQCLGGYNMNRSWIRPSSKIYPVEATVIRLIDRLVQTRPLLFFLDFHGHTSQYNAFTYSVWNGNDPFNEYEAVFPQLMAQHTDLFDEKNSISIAREAYTKTMRVALHHRYKVPFSYTLEMSYGGMNAGSRRKTQFSQGGYREIGQASVRALAEMMIDHVPIDRMTRNYEPPVNDPL